MSTSLPTSVDAPTEKLVYRVAEVAQLLGVSEQTIYNRLATGAIQARKFGGVTVILREDFLAMLRNLPAATYTLTPTNHKILARDAERARLKAAQAERVAA
jgi:excisionase family DNA binding protein